MGLMIGAGGCAAWLPFTGKGEKSKVPPVITEQSDSSDSLLPSEQADRSALAAVQEFLERTKDYEWPPREAAAGNESGDAYLSSPSASGLPLEAKSVLGSLGSGLESRPISPGENHQKVQSSFAYNTPINRQMAVSNATVSLPGHGDDQGTLRPPILELVEVLRGMEPIPSLRAKLVASASNEPMGIAVEQSSEDWRNWLSQLEAKAEASQGFDDEWRLRLAQLAFYRDAEARQVSEHLTSDTRSLLEQFVETAIVVRRAARNPGLVEGRAIQAVDALRNRMIKHADPEIPVIALCRKVVTFGVYEPMASEDFIGAVPIPTIVYTEVRNLRMDQDADGLFKAKLSTRLELFEPNGSLAWEREEPEIVDSSRSRRTDFFLAQRVTLPVMGELGMYTLKVTVTDMLSGRTNQAVHQMSLGSSAEARLGRG